MMENDRIEDRDEELIADDSAGFTLESADPGRRKFVSAAAAVPIVLAVSGRSALACTTPGTGLSLVAWCSVHPKGASGAALNLSHAPKGTNIGHKPDDWRPKFYYNQVCFTKQWPTSCKPFNKCKEKYTGTTKTYYHSNCTTYTNLDKDDNTGGYDPSGFHTGNCPTWSSRSVCRILIDDASSKSVDWHCAAAHLNALTVADYPLTPTDVHNLRTQHKLHNITLTDADICAFLRQTWGETS